MFVFYTLSLVVELQQPAYLFAKQQTE